jgi:hypothetical protein
MHTTESSAMSSALKAIEHKFSPRKEAEPEKAIPGSTLWYKIAYQRACDQNMRNANEIHSLENQLRWSQENLRISERRLADIHAEIADAVESGDWGDVIAKYTMQTEIAEGDNA